MRSDTSLHRGEGKSYQQVFDMAKLMQFTDCPTRLLKQTHVYSSVHLLRSGGEWEEARTRQSNCLFNIDFRNVYFYCDPESRYILNKTTKTIWQSASKLSAICIQIIIGLYSHCVSNVRERIWMFSFPRASLESHNLICGEKIFGIIRGRCVMCDPIRLFFCSEKISFHVSSCLRR